MSQVLFEAIIIKIIWIKHFKTKNFLNLLTNIKIKIFKVIRWLFDMWNKIKTKYRKKSHNFLKIRWKRNMNSREHKLIIMIWLKILQMTEKLSRIKFGSKRNSFKNNWMKNLLILKIIWLRAWSIDQEN